MIAVVIILSKSPLSTTETIIAALLTLIVTPFAMMLVFWLFDRPNPRTAEEFAEQYQKNIESLMARKPNKKP